ncbi:hypothetical protein [Paenibacillus sp. R14(2021)]|uniref:hypothetical protein n=1 Tax=Paenibacillus sp. R14(2021) TaxID=2859228 RepID=UPI001C611BBB|nr:hypothetical protein [Paenibacillus sp. R14(2021)]
MTDKDIGQTVSIIYMDNKGRFSQRRIRIDAVQEGIVKAFDLEKRAPRVFKADHILAVERLKRHAG